MALRTLSSAVDTLLNNGTGFTYAHLVKFERPKLNTQFDVDQPTKYAYITDGSIDIAWNGDTYFANKLKKIGNFTENSQASASASTLTISALALGTSLTDTLTFNSSAGTVTGTKDFVQEGLAEGDTILFTASSSGQNNAKKFVITGFQSNNTVLVLDTIYEAITNESSVGYTLDLVSPELLGPVTDRTATDYSNYINRQVFIYKALFDEETGLMVGDPFLMFKGIVAGAKLKQDPFKGSEISWSLTSHWGDFVRVNGRLTSDHSHRALKANGEPDKTALVDQRYANDFGFMHAEKAINLTAVYQVMETRYKEKKRGGLAGLVGLKKLQEYQVEVDREVDLRFNTSARRLPVVYGVQKVDAIPIFIDSDKDDSTNIYAAYAICEGQVAGIYDVHFNNQSTICVDANDSGARNSQTANNNVEVVCEGRMDRGDTLSSIALTGSQNVKGIDSQFNPADFNNALGTPGYPTYWNGSASKYDILADWGYGAITSSTGTTSGLNLTAQLGIVDNQSAKFTPGIPTEIIFHAGKTRQKADPMLAKKGAAGEFKIQSDYSNTKTNYWGANHQLLDTAYVAVRYEIGEGETEIQPMEFVVKGKYLQCYNYDYSYSYNKLKNDVSAWNSFEIGSEYTLKEGDTGGSGSTIGTVRIADKYEIYDHAGNIDKRIRFHEDPEIGSNTTFYLDDGSSNYFYLETYNRTISSTSIAARAELPVSSVTTNGSSTTDVTLDFTSASAGQQALPGLNQALMEMCLAANTAGAGLDCIAFAQQLETATVASNVITLPQNVTDEVSNLDKIVFADQLVVQSLNLSGGTNIDNGDYKVRLIYDDGAGDYKLQERTIIAHDTSPSGEDILTLDSEWESDYIPDGTSNYTYSIRSMGDLRVSLNPAVQLLDYLTNNRYGKGLTASDLHLTTFASTARTCDTNSDITVISTTSPNVGDYYYYDANDNYFRGKVESSTARTVAGTSYYEVVFTDVIGKLGYKYLDWKTYNTGDLVWNDGKLYSWSSTLAGSSAAGTISLTKEGTSDTITLDTNSANDTVGAASGNYPKSKVSYEGNCLVKSFSDNNSFNGSGYSIYDADEVKYWRYMGWDHHDQRWATRHQLNTIIDTSNSIFDNINNILAQFNGVLRYENGKYALDIKTAAPTLETVRYIDETDIIGEITVEDSGTKGSYNAMSLSFPDPQNKFSNRSITYTNSDYIKQDKGVTKSGSVSTPDITNYFNARIQATQYLIETRNNLKVSFTMVPEGIKLLAGTLIKLSNSKFGWVDKYFRIETLTFREDCLVDIDAEEHTDSAFLVTKEVSTGTAAFPVSSSKDEEPLPIPGAPSGLSYDTTNNRGGVALSWTNNSSFAESTWKTEVFRSTDNNRANAVVVGTALGSTFTDPITNDADGTVYYWIRHSVETISRRDGKKRLVYSNFNTGANSGLQANVEVAADGVDGINGTNGVNGDDGARNAIAYYFYSTAQSGAPSTPSSSIFSYNFSTSTPSSSSGSWLTTFNPSALSSSNTGDNKYWAIRVTFQEATFGGSVGVTLSSVFTWTNFDGLVTFTNLANGRDENGNLSTTLIDGGAITANTINVDSLKSNSAGNSSTFEFNTSGVDFGFGSTISTTGYITSGTSNSIAYVGEATGSSQYGIGGIGNASGAGGVFHNSTNSDSYILLGHSSYAIRMQDGDLNFQLDYTGNLWTDGNVTAYAGLGSSSDIRLKDNIEPISYALNKIQTLRGVTFDFKKTGERSTGLIAQEVERVLPEAVYEAGEFENPEEKMKAVKYGNLAGLFVEAIKELQGEILELKSEVKRLKNGSSNS